jgi:hypothetical protein
MTSCSSDKNFVRVCITRCGGPPGPPPSADALFGCGAAALWTHDSSPISNGRNPREAPAGRWLRQGGVRIRNVLVFRRRSETTGSCARCLTFFTVAPRAGRAADRQIRGGGGSRAAERLRGEVMSTATRRLGSTGPASTRGGSGSAASGSNGPEGEAGGLLKRQSEPSLGGFCAGRLCIGHIPRWRWPAIPQMHSVAASSS